jgi:hypothetical protein
MQRTRIMPANHWDWSMPVKFSQGWAIDGPVRWIFVGGQISADEHGRTIGVGDIACPDAQRLRKHQDRCWQRPAPRSATS